MEISLLTFYLKKLGLTDWDRKLSVGVIFLHDLIKKWNFKA
jgi:hypothetical protein